MNILKYLFSEKKEGNDSLVIVKKDLEINNNHLQNIASEFNLDNYSNRLSWWQELPVEWKRLLLLKSTFEDETQIDINIVPDENYMDRIFNAERFCSQYRPISSLKPLNAFKYLKELLIETIAITDFKEIADMTQLTVIHAGCSKLVSLEGLENLENLERLTIAGTDVTSLIPIATLNNLIDLDIRGTLIDPLEVEKYKKLHPKTVIDFITPMNPLRANSESQENPLLDYLKNQMNKNGSNDIIPVIDVVNLSHLEKKESKLKADHLMILDLLSYNIKIRKITKDANIKDFASELWSFHREYSDLISNNNIQFEDLSMFDFEDLLYGIVCTIGGENIENWDLIIPNKTSEYFNLSFVSKINIGTSVFNIEIISSTNQRSDLIPSIINHINNYGYTQFIVDDPSFNELFNSISGRLGNNPKNIHILRERNYLTTMNLNSSFYWLQWDVPVYIAYLRKYCRDRQIS